MFKKLFLISDLTAEIRMQENPLYHTTIRRFVLFSSKNNQEGRMKIEAYLKPHQTSTMKLFSGNS